jgi:hypothetical protein
VAIVADKPSKRSVLASKSNSLFAFAVENALLSVKNFKLRDENGGCLWSAVKVLSRIVQAIATGAFGTVTGL